MHWRIYYTLDFPPLPSKSVIVAIPTSPAHIRERGYDHMALIARRLGVLRKVAVLKVLVRDNTLTQHHANRKDRIEQAKSAFRVDKTLDPDLTYIVVDDIVTTGATIEQAAKQLRARGATNIWVAAIARQPLD